MLEEGGLAAEAVACADFGVGPLEAAERSRFLGERLGDQAERRYLSHDAASLRTPPLVPSTWVTDSVTYVLGRASRGPGGPARANHS